MIEIIKEHVEMPNYIDRRFQYGLIGNKWVVKDTSTDTIIYKGRYEDAAIRSHNLNKKYYRDLKLNK